MGRSAISSSWSSPADALGELLDEVIFVGAATVTLWITDPGAPPIRPTKDVDVLGRGHYAQRLSRVEAALFCGQLCDVYIAFTCG